MTTLVDSLNFLVGYTTWLLIINNIAFGFSRSFRACLVWCKLNFHISTFKSHHSNSLPNSHFSNSKFLITLLILCLAGISQWVFIFNKSTLCVKLWDLQKLILSLFAQNGNCMYSRRTLSPLQCSFSAPNCHYRHSLYYSNWLTQTKNYSNWC